MDPTNPSTANEILRKQLVTIQRDYHHLLAENAMLKEQNYQLSQSLNIVVSKLTQLGYRVEPPFDIAGQIRRVREARDEALKAATASGRGGMMMMGADGKKGKAGGSGGESASGPDGEKDGGSLMLMGDGNDHNNALSGGQQSGGGSRSVVGGGGIIDGTAHKRTTSTNMFRCVAELKEHKSHVQSAAFAPYFGEDGSNTGGGGGGGGNTNTLSYLATGAFDSRINLWRIPSSLLHNTGNPIKYNSVASIVNGHSRNVSALSWFADYRGFLVSSSFDGTSKVWNVQGCTGLTAQASPPAPVHTITAANGAYMVANAALGTSMYACADSRNSCYVVDFRAGGSNSGGGMGMASVSGAAMNFGAGGSGAGGGPLSTYAAGGIFGSGASSLSWQHSARITSLTGDVENPYLLLTGYADGGIKVWDLRRVAQPVGQGNAASTATTSAIDGTTNMGGGGFYDKSVIRLNMMDGTMVTVPLGFASAVAAATPASGGDGAPQPPTSPSTSPIAAEWLNDESHAPVWHLGLQSAAVGGGGTNAPGGLGLNSPLSISSNLQSNPSLGNASMGGGNVSSGVKSASTSSHQSNLLTVSEDGMARIYDINVVVSNMTATMGATGGGVSVAGGGGDVSPTNLTTSGGAAISGVVAEYNPNIPLANQLSPSTSAAVVSGSPTSTMVQLKHSVRTVVPGIHARGMPIKASLWLGATFCGKGQGQGGGVAGAGGKGGAGSSHHHGGANGGRRRTRTGNDFDDENDDDDDDDDEDGADDDETAMRGDGKHGAGGRHSHYGRHGANGVGGNTRADAKIHESDLLIVGSATGNASVYDVTDPDEPVLLERLEGHKSLVTGVVVLPPSNQWRRPLMATYSNDHTVRLYTSVSQN